MSGRRAKSWGWLAALALAAAYPLGGVAEGFFYRLTGFSFGQQLTTLYIYAILALGLNVVVGYTGLLHLGIAAFFGIGAYVAAILTVPAYPFQVSFTAALIASTIIAALMGMVMGAPTLRLRGDYLAIVTLGFGEVVRFSLRNFEQITAGTRGLNPIPPPALPAWLDNLLLKWNWQLEWSRDYWLFYYLTLGLLAAVIVLLRNLEQSRIGRAWVAIREDELAATCMGVNAARAKLSALALGGGLAGMAGALYVTVQITAQPDTFDFNRSIIILCCIILGGLGSLRGTLLGVFLLVGFDNLLAPLLDDWLQRSRGGQTESELLTFSNWKLMIFGLALILMMRFRPEGLLPSVRVQKELHAPQGH